MKEGGGEPNGGNTKEELKEKKKVPTYKGDGTLDMLLQIQMENINWGVRISSISDDAKKAIINFTSPEEVKERPIAFIKVKLMVPRSWY